MDNECGCIECFNNDDGICDLSYISVDEDGMCLDKNIKGEN